MKQQLNGYTILIAGWFLICVAPFAFYSTYIWYYTYGLHTTYSISLSDIFRTMLFVASPFLPFIGWDIVKQGRKFSMKKVSE